MSGFSPRIIPFSPAKTDQKTTDADPHSNSQNNVPFQPQYNSVYIGKDSQIKTESYCGFLRL
ncbi:MAG TPA: hypothetical protein DCY53_10945 [Desulfobacteraceae bacterium]|nr:hypothetical protein [Desulfobacteraceae bacterium]